MSKHADIDTALLQAVVDANLGLPIAQENAPFDKPTDGSPWAAAFVVPSPGGVRAVTCGEQGEDEQVGYMQIDLNYPLHRGVAAARTKGDAVSEHFPLGRALSHGVARVTVASCSRSRGLEVDGWYRVSITVSWYARVPRNT